jgi:STE24 endopeptidase
VGVRTIDPDRLGISPWKAFKTDPREWFGEEEIAKAKRYGTPLRRVRAVKIALNTVVDLAVIRSHLLPNLLDRWNIDNWFVGVVVAMGVISVIGVVLNLPFDWWTEMVYDKKWEFSTMTPKLFVTDAIKGLTLGLVLNGIITGLLWWIIRSTELWWLLGWAAISVLSIGLAIIYPRVIAPIFNKIKQLDNEQLHAKILVVAHSVGADISKVEVEDTSKRTKRSNAYVGGAGKTRRMVICDTMTDWPEDQITWVSAHEIGHWRRKHIIKLVPWLVSLSLVDFVVLKLIVDNERVLRFAGVDSLRDPGAVALFFFVFSLPSLVTGPIGQYFSRVHEREADLFGLEAVPDPDAAMASFRHLQEENLGDLTPSLWKRLNHSHPPTAERLAMIAEWKRRQAAAN